MEKKLEEKNKDHDLHGNWEGYRECHILPDWLLVYKYIEDELIYILLELERIVIYLINELELS